MLRLYQFYVLQLLGPVNDLDYSQHLDVQQPVGFRLSKFITLNCTIKTPWPVRVLPRMFILIVLLSLKVEKEG